MTLDWHASPCRELITSLTVVVVYEYPDGPIELRADGSNWSLSVMTDARKVDTATLAREQAPEPLGAGCAGGSGAA